MYCWLGIGDGGENDLEGTRANCLALSFFLLMQAFVDIIKFV